MARAWSSLARKMRFSGHRRVLAASCELFSKLITKLVEGFDSKTPQATAGYRPFQGFDEGLHGMVHNNFPPARTLAAKSDPG